MNPMIRNATISAHDIQRLTTKLNAAMRGESMPDVVLSMIVYATKLMKPDCDDDEMQKMVMNTSEFMTLNLWPAGVTN
jgi:hypothetical protein